MRWRKPVRDFLVGTAAVGVVVSVAKVRLLKTSAHFDSTAKHPECLGGEVPEVKKLAPAA